MTSDIRIVDEEKLIIAEGPLWNDSEELLYTLDFRGKRIRTTNLEILEHSEMQFDSDISVLGLTDDDRLVIATDRGVYLANGSENLTPVCVPENLKGRRFNDGKVGPDGRFYVGSKDANHQAGFYRFDYDGSCTELFGGVGNSNGIAWSSDHKTMYYIDSPDRVLYAFDFDEDKGAVSNKRVIMACPADGEFDGMTIDADDKLWAAVWGSYRAFRIDPVKGEVIDSIELPCEKVTCCAFAGKDLKTLILTTASYDTDERDQPLAGKTFAVSVEVPGVMPFRYKYTK